MKVLLIEPRNCWIGVNIALGYLAAALKKAGIDVKILDLTNHRDLPADVMVRKTVESYKPDLVGITLFYISYYQAREIISVVKQCGDIPVIVGGPQMMIEREKILHDMPELDYALIGDGEEALVDLCRAIENRAGFEKIAGLVHRVDGKVVKNPDRVLSMRIDDLPFPDYDAFGVERMRRYTIITSRGCPFNCTYCFRSTPKWRARSAENIVAELKQAVEKYGIEEFCIVDDAFNIREERVFQFCDLLNKSGLNLKWTCSGVRADRMTEAMAKRMREAGCYCINIGVETLDPELYKLLDRQETMEHVRECIRILKKYDYFSIGYCLLGIPGETKEKTMATYREAKKFGLAYVSFAVLIPFPGTRMYDIIMSRPGVRVLEDYKRVSTIWTYDPEYSVMKTVFELPEYSAKDKIDMYNRLRTLEGDPRPPYHKSLFVFALHSLWWAIKYDPLHAHATVARLAKNFLNRIWKSKGRSVYMSEDVYKTSFLKDLEDMRAPGGR